MNKTPPEQLSERQLFTEYVELLKQRETPTDAYGEVKLHERQARLLAEVGERLEALEAAKSLLGEGDLTDETNSEQSDRENLSAEPHQLSF